ncbi:hypothetical protein [Candidatus Poriferisocius sp.]|uniref:hypothetical protein n=1 Tax=Candidatus Poriferisocius sp. TaxID=3101276 RepID=UPI003B0283B3
MTRHTALISDFFGSVAAKLRCARCAPSGSAPVPGAARRLLLLFVALAVFAASLMFAGPSSAHEVPPEYSCSIGKLVGDQCLQSADPEYSCSSGMPEGSRCKVTADPEYRCSSGKPEGDICRQTAAPMWTCSSGAPTGTQCVETAVPTYSCTAGTLSGSQCLHSADPVYSCTAGTPTGTQCVETAVPTYSCISGTLTGSQCQQTAAPMWSCSSGAPTGSQCVETAVPSYSCTAGTLSGSRCLHSADPVYSCSSGALSGSRCLHSADPVYSCPSGMLRGTSCVLTHEPVCTLNNDFATCDTPGVAYHCSPGYTLSGTLCTKTTAAEAGCPSGYLTGAFGICYKYTAASAECPAGYPPPSQGLCLRYTAAQAGCPAGFALSGGQCTKTTAAAAGCPAGYELGTFDLEGTTVTFCYKNTPAQADCETGYALIDGQCTKYTAASAECPAGYPPPSQGLCLRYTAAQAGCPAGFALSGGQCTKTTAAAAGCPAGYELGTFDLEGTTVTFCYKNTPARADCETGYALIDGQCTKYTAASSSCPSGYPPPSQGLCLRYTPVQAGCPTGYTLSGANCDHAHTAITGLEATATTAAGVAYSDDFTVTPAASAVSVSGDGCALSPASSSGTHTLTATRPDAGTRTCTVTAGTATATATITFTPAPTPTPTPAPTSTPTPTPTPRPMPVPVPLVVPGGFGCLWLAEGDDRVVCTWDGVQGAAGGYAVKYELTASIRGTTRKFLQETTTNGPAVSVGMNRYVTEARFRVATIGPYRTGPFTAWVAAVRPVPCPQDSALLGRAGMGSHRHGQGACHVHEVGEPSCSASEDRAYTVHAQAPNAPEPAHRHGVVLACHPGRGQGVVSPQPLSVACTADGRVTAGWAWPSTPGGARRITASKERFEVEGDLAHFSRWSRAGDQTSDELLTHTWDNAAPSAVYTIRVRMVWAQEGEPPIEGPWTVRSTTTCPDRFKPRNVQAECNSHGVVKVSWDRTNGATKYRLAGLDYEGPGSADGAGRLAVYAQKNEGRGYVFAVSAWTAGAWSSPSDRAPATCGGLDPRNPGGTPDNAYEPDWTSPNATKTYEGGDLYTWENPNVARLVADEATKHLGAQNCGDTGPKTGGGWTRTCTFVWTEPLNVGLTDELVRSFDHGNRHAHDGQGQFWHTYKNDEGHAANALHRHCLVHDANGDGDTTDPEDNDGTCPHTDTDLPDLPWHPALPNKNDPFWKDALREGLVSGTIGASLGTVGGPSIAAVMARLGLVAGGTAAGPIGAVVGVLVGAGVGVLLAWLKDDKPIITIAGHTGCLDPPSGVDWHADRWQLVTNSFTETKQAHGYETVYKHVIYSCDKVEAK